MMIYEMLVLLGMVGCQVMLLVLFASYQYTGNSSSQPPLPLPLPPLQQCISISVPGKTPQDHQGRFSYITSYTWVSQNNALYVTWLGTNFFLIERDVRLKQNRSLDLAFNQSFNFEQLESPDVFVQYARLGKDLIASCYNVRAAQKDITLFGKMGTFKCQFDSNITNDLTLLLLYSPVTSTCWKLDISTSKGRLAAHSTRRLVETTTEPSMSICISGIKQFIPDSVQIIAMQVDITRRIGARHVYLGLNSNSIALRNQYVNALHAYVQAGVVSIIPSPTSDEDIIFTQAKLPFLNECLMHAKFHGDLLLGIWDLDEIPKMRSTNNISSSLAQMLVESNPQFAENRCFVNMQSRSCISAVVAGNSSRNNHTIPLHKRFPFPTTRFCANYSKAISVVPRVDLVGIHLPEHCSLYPEKGFSVRAKPSFVHATEQISIVHYVQLVANRFGFCRGPSSKFKYNTTVDGDNACKV